MPELPEVEAICRQIRSAVAGRRIVRVRVLRASAVKPQRPSRLTRLAKSRTITGVRRRGKNILIDLSGGLTVRVHLRISGELEVRKTGEDSPPDRVVFQLTGRRRLVFADPRALGVVHIHRTEELPAELAGLGPEPLSAAFTLEGFRQRALGSRQPAKLFLMDQRRVAGLGNIYAAEALFHAGIHPSTRMSRLAGPRLETLHLAIVSVLRDAVQSTTTAYGRPGRGREAEPFIRFVYGREGEPCYVCGRKIRRLAQGGRSTYYCPGCQKR